MPPVDSFTHIVTENIPRVISGDPDKDVVITGSLDKIINPNAWNSLDVCQFLRINDCGQYCESFNRKVRKYKWNWNQVLIYFVSKVSGKSKKSKILEYFFLFRLILED